MTSTATGTTLPNALNDTPEHGDVKAPVGHRAEQTPMPLAGSARARSAPRTRASPAAWRTARPAARSGPERRERCSSRRSKSPGTSPIAAPEHERHRAQDRRQQGERDRTAAGEHAASTAPARTRPARAGTASTGSSSWPPSGRRSRRGDMPARRSAHTVTATPPAPAAASSRIAAIPASGISMLARQLSRGTPRANTVRNSTA